MMQPLAGKFLRELTTSRVTSAGGRKGETKPGFSYSLSFEFGFPSYHQNFSGGSPSRSGNSKRSRVVRGKVSEGTREATSASTTVGKPSLRARKGMLTV